MLLASFLGYSQIIKVSSGHTVTHDTAVVMPVTAYRLIRLKTISCDTLISLKDSIINQLHERSSVYDSISEAHRKLRILFDHTISRKNEAIDDISKVNNDLLTEMAKMEYKRKWWQRKETYGGIAVGMLVILLAR